MRGAVFGLLGTLIASTVFASPKTTTPTRSVAATPAPASKPIRATVPKGPPPKIMPLSEVKAGMTGYALTVFKGTKPEPFKLHVVSVLRNFLPKEDVILIRADDPRVEFSGIVAGMSGSPVYIDGKLVGAIAYAWSFSKEPLGGVTPIETMLAEGQRPRRSGQEILALDDGKSGPKTANAGAREAKQGDAQQIDAKPGDAPKGTVGEATGG